MKWWVRKYKLPSNHELFTSQTLFDLLVEYYEDIFEAHPLEKYRQDDGQIMLSDTGDALIDEWERQLAAGQEPNIQEAFSEEVWAKINRLSRKQRGLPTVKEAPPSPQEISLFNSKDY